MKIKNLFLAVLTMFALTTTQAQSDIVDLAVNSEAHTTLVKAVKASGLVQTLKGKGPFTIFAPTNAAFAKLPDGTAASLMEPENKGKLSALLTYHVVAGKFTTDDVMGAIKKGDGEFVFKTITGGTLMATMQDGNVTITDESGNIAKVTSANNVGTNGVLHVVDSVLNPKDSK